MTTTPRCACDSLLHGCGVATIKFAGNEGSVAPVGHPAKQEATRMSQPKQAMRPLQGSSAPTEVAELKPSTAHYRKATKTPGNSCTVSWGFSFLTPKIHQDLFSCRFPQAQRHTKPIFSFASRNVRRSCALCKEVCKWYDNRNRMMEMTVNRLVPVSPMMLRMVWLIDLRKTGED